MKMEFVIGLIFAIIVLVLILLLIRQVVLWYFKIDVIVRQNEERNRYLKRIADNTKAAENTLQTKL